MPSSSSITSIPVRYNNTGELHAALCTAEPEGVKVPAYGVWLVKIGSYRYTVNFQQKTVTETFVQKVRGVLGRCFGCDHASTTKVKALFFPAKIVRICHRTNPAVAQNMLEQQARRATEAGVGAFSSGLASSDTPLQTFGPPLGRGAFGVVASVAPEGGGPMLALKTPKGAFARADLERERGILLGLDHPNIIGIDAQLSLEGRLVMEYGGISLTDIIKADSSRLVIDDGHICKERMMSTMTQILKGLVYLRGKRILHGDIRPDNILVNPNTGHVHLADFGLAQQLIASGTSNKCWGGLGYMAPEVWVVRGNPLATYVLEADMYSAGCVFYEMLTGTPYAKGLNGQCPDSDKLSIQITSERLPMLTAREAMRMRALLCGMLNRDPRKRLKPAEALNKLQRLQHDVSRM